MGLRPTQGNEKRPRSGIHSLWNRYLFLVIPTEAKRTGGICGPPKVVQNASVRHPLSLEPLPFPCHPDRSEAERRDLRFRRPFVEMFFDRAQRS